MINNILSYFTLLDQTYNFLCKYKTYLSELTYAEHSLLKKGPAFCPVPKDVNWQKVTDDMEKFERRIYLAIFFHGRNAEDNPRTVDYQFPAIPSASQWFPPKSIFPEVEVFLNNVKIDIFKPANFRTSKDERLALRSLKSSKILLEFKIKVLGSFSSVNKSIKIRILRQLNNDLHYDSLDSDPTLDHFEVVKEWSCKWFSKEQISLEIAKWVVNLNRESLLGMSKHTNVITHFDLLHPVVVQQSNSFLLLQNSISNLFHRVSHLSLRILPILLTN